MSGPLPTFAATAAFGRRSSQPWLSTLTVTPVCLLYLSVFSSHSVSSPLTNFAGRSTRKDAPCSGLRSMVGSSARAGSTRLAPTAAPVIAAAPIFSESRRENSLIVSPPWVRAWIRPPVSQHQIDARLRIEKVHAVEARREGDAFPRPEPVAIAESPADALPSDMREDERAGARRFDHVHGGA